MATFTVDATSQRFGSASQPEPDVCVLHTTEGMSWPGYSGGGEAPNATIKPIPGKGIQVREHIDFDCYAKALMNLPGGVETNRRGVIQFELIGTCDPKHKGDPAWYYWPDADDAVLSALADYLRPILARYDIPHVAPGFLAYPDSYGSKRGQRMSNAAWDAFNGICGHQHVPENDHGDPGAFPIAALINYLNGQDGFLMALTEKQQTDLYNRVMGGIPAGDVRGTKNPDGSPAWVLTSADGNYLVQRQSNIANAIKAIAETLPAAVAQAVTDALGGDFDATVTLTKKSEPVT